MKELKAQLEELTQKYKKIEAAFLQYQAKPIEDPGLKKEFQNLETTYVECRKNLHLHMTREREEKLAREAKEDALFRQNQEARFNGNNNHFSSNAILQTEGNRRTNNIIVGTTGN